MKKIEEIDTKLLEHFGGNPRLELMIKEGLFEDIKQHGVLMPLLVSPIKNGKYHVIDGERRRKSAVELKIPTLTCIIEDMDEQTKWKRAYDLNVLNRQFTPFESAKNFYLRITKFRMTTREISGEKASKKSGSDPSSGQLSQSNVQRLVQLVKLPKEVQKLVHRGKLAVEPAYTLSQLAFDLEFPNIGNQTPSKWLSKNPKESWDFCWDKEPQTWKDKRIKLQISLAKRYINKKFTLKKQENQFDALKAEFKRLVKLEKERRIKEGEDRLKLEEELAEFEKKLKPALQSYNDLLKKDLMKIIPNETKRGKSGVNLYFLEEDNLPDDFNDFIFDLTHEFAKELPDESYMKVIRDARNSVVKFEKQIKKKDPTIFEFSDKPSCCYCGHKIDQQTIDNRFKIADGRLQEMEAKEDLVIKTRDRTADRLYKIFSDIVDPMDIILDELDDFTEKKEEK